SKQAQEKKFEVFICTGDRDSFQLVNENVTILYPKKGVTEMSRMTPSAVYEKYGLTPKQYPDFAALRGDPSDNLPSIPGVGEKTATKWIADYGTLEQLIANAEQIPGKVGQSLRDNLKTVQLNRELTSLLDNLQINTQIEDLAWTGFDSKLMANFFEKMEIRALKDRLKALPQTDSVEGQNHEITVVKVTPSELDEMLKDQTKPIAVSFNLIDEELQGYAIATSASRIYYVEDSRVSSWISNPNLPKIVHSAKSLIKKFELNGLVADVELLAYLANPGSRNLDLTDLAQQRLGVTTLSDQLFSQFDPRSAAWIYSLEAELTSEINSKGMKDLYIQ
ncbi:MAG: 5'-3' exonuclease H3TH domain-containing protein, partial [Candidatus Nanopelagicus sp.]